MQIENIHFENQNTKKLEISSKEEIPLGLEKLGLSAQPVIVVVGGAGGIREEDWSPIRKAMNTIATVAHETGAAIIDGGTDSGVMAVSGQIRAEKGYQFPLIGIAAKGTVKWPGRELGDEELNKYAGPLESHHTHFILSPGSNWGDESPWIVDAVTFLSQGHRSVTILLNGGNVSRIDIDLSLQVGRPVIALAGTGRYADEIANQPDRPQLITVVPADDEQVLKETIQVALGNPVQ